MPSKRKKMRQEKRKKRGGEKAKSKSQDCCVEILLSAHARTSQAEILVYTSWWKATSAPVIYTL